MPKFRILIRGENFHFRDGESDGIAPFGFYVQAFAEAESAAAAELAGVELVRASPRLREGVLNPVDDRPRMFVEESEALTDWPADCALPLSGFSFYDEREDEPT